MSQYVPDSTTVQPLGRRKRTPQHLSQLVSKLENQVTMQSFGKLVPTSTTNTNTDTVVLERELVITFLDIGQGNCTFIECPGGETILIDCGSVTKKAMDLVGTHAREYITKRLTGGTLDYLIISHPDKDHMNIVHKVLEGVKLKTVLCGGALGDYSGRGKDDFRPWVEEITGKKLKELMIDGGKFYREAPDTTADKRMIQCKGMDAFIVSANAQTIGMDQIKPLNITGVETIDTGTPSNSACIVVYLHYKGRKILICGDATFSTEAIMLDGPWKNAVVVDALEGGHHGSAQSFSDAFLKATNPLWIHFSADNKGTFRHPTWEVVNRVLTNCPRIKASYDFGPHGIVVGPILDVGLEKKGGDFVELSARVKAIFDYMTEKKVAAKDALKVLLPQWQKEGEWNAKDPKPEKPIEEHWLAELISECLLLDNLDNPLVDYWAKWLDDYAAERQRLVTEKDDINKFKYYWDWSVIDFNMFTTLVTANLGAYWILTVKPNGEMYTDLA